VLGHDYDTHNEQLLRQDFKQSLNQFLKVAWNDTHRGLYPTEEGPGRTDAFGRIANASFGDAISPDNYRVANAPVDYPQLWDIWTFDWVQWNGSAQQPMARNIGEALGVGATLGFFDNAGQPLQGDARYPSSVRVRDLNLIEETLLKYGDDHSVLNLAELDGYFCALVSSPAPVDIAEWFPAIWGGQNPQWESAEEAKQFLELCVRHMNARAAQLATDAKGFRARFDDTEHQGQTLTLAEEWCFGYIRGAAIGNWPELPAEQAALLEKISWCAEQDNFELPADLDVQAHQQRVSEIEPAARALHDYSLAQR